MSNNREVRVVCDNVHILMGIQRMSKQGNKNCIRQVIKDYDLDLKLLESKLKVFGGEWRIYKTVNARNVEKARIWLLKRLIESPEVASYVDSEWRTALLQKECIYSDVKFMLDIDTQEEDKIEKLENLIKEEYLKTQNPEGYTSSVVLERIKSPKGWHYITRKFDTREVCKLDYVTLLRDGYHYVKTIREDSLLS